MDTNEKQPKWADTHEYSVMGEKNPIPGITNAESEIRKILVRDGRPVMCHRQAPIINTKQVVGNGQPAYDIQRIPCSTDCGKAMILINENNNTCYWEQRCDSILARFALVMPEDDKNQPESGNDIKKGPFDRQ